MKARELAASGITEESAREEAIRSLGNLTLVREQVRGTWSFTWLTDAVQDCKYGARSLMGQPAFTVAALVALLRNSTSHFERNECVPIDLALAWSLASCRFW